MRKILIDLTLTPESASVRGLEWLQDLIYDPEAPENANRKIENSVNSGEYYLGSSATPEGEVNNMVGVYRKIGQNKKSDRS